MFSGVGLATMDFGLPEQFPCVAVETQHRLVRLRLLRGSQIDAVAYDDWRSMPSSGNLRFPQNVIRFAPFHRRRLARRCNAVAGWPTPLWPVGCGI